MIIGSFQGEIKEQYVKELVCCKEKNHIVLEIKHRFCILALGGISSELVYLRVMISWKLLRSLGISFRKSKHFQK